MDGQTEMMRPTVAFHNVRMHIPGALRNVVECITHVSVYKEKNK